MVLTKIISALLAPLSLVLISIVVGLILLSLRWRRAGYTGLVTGLVLFLIFSSEPIARWMLMPLENRYSPISDTEILEDIRWIVVLGSNASGVSDHPATTRLSGVAGLRLLEGVRLHRALPNSHLILSGGTVFGDAPSATVMSRAAADLGADPERVRIHPNPRNTSEEARMIFEAVGNEPYLLVTSASHMPRAMALALKAGTSPIPAPTAMRTTTTTSHRDPQFYLPSANAVAMSERAFHEYMGLLWGRLRGEL